MGALRDAFEMFRTQKVRFLLTISGIGPVKAERWSDALLAVVHQH